MLLCSQWGLPCLSCSNHCKTFFLMSPSHGAGLGIPGMGQCRTQMASGIARATSSGRRFNLEIKNTPVTPFYAIWLYASLFTGVFTDTPHEIRV